MKVRASVKPICANCKVIIRTITKKKGHRKVKVRNVRVVCSNPKHKQRQG